jgi:hypothetical protein
MSKGVELPPVLDEIYRRCSGFMNHLKMPSGMLLLVWLLLPGCATSGFDPAHAGPDAAFLVAVSPVRVHSIDGQPVSESTKRFAVPPERHTLMVKYLDVQSDLLGNGQVVELKTTGNLIPESFTAEPGHTYYIRAEMLGASWHPLISEAPEQLFQDVKAP